MPILSIVSETPVCVCGGACGAGNPIEEKKVYREGRFYEVTTDLQEGSDGRQEGTLQGPIRSYISSSKEKKR